MTLENAVLRFAGIMMLLSVLLTVYLDPGFVWFTVFIGANMFQSTYTGFCPATMVFKKLGLKSCAEPG